MILRLVRQEVPGCWLISLFQSRGEYSSLEHFLDIKAEPITSFSAATDLQQHAWRDAMATVGYLLKKSNPLPGIACPELRLPLWEPESRNANGSDGVFCVFGVGPGRAGPAKPALFCHVCCA